MRTRIVIVVTLYEATHLKLRSRVAVKILSGRLFGDEGALAAYTPPSTPDEPALDADTVMLLNRPERLKG
jgi:hypothetical protein